MTRALFDVFIAYDDALAKHGVHPTSRRWREALHAFYTHPTANEIWASIGRGGDKSRTLGVKRAIVETFGREWRVPPGERHAFMINSENGTESGKTLRIAQQYLGLLFGEDDVEATAEAVGLRSHADRGILVRPNRTGATRGFRCIGWTADEVASWPTEGAEPANEVIANLRACSVTHHAERPRGAVVSTPGAAVGFFYEGISEGSSDHRIIIRGPSWEWNESVTEQATHDLERDPARHAQEYAAEFGEAAGLVFGEKILVTQAYGAEPKGLIGSQPFMALDPSSLTGRDGFCYAIAYFAHPSGERVPKMVMMSGHAATPVRDEFGYIQYEETPTAPVLRVAEVGGWTKHQLSQATYPTLVADLADRARAWGAQLVLSDQRESAGLEGFFSQESLTFRSYAWSNESKEEAIRTLRRLLRERAISIVPHDDLLHQMLTLGFRVLPSGRIEYQTSGRDYVSTIITIAHAMNDPKLLGLREQYARLDGVPMRARRGGRVEIETDRGI